MHLKTSLLFFIYLSVYGQLSVDELFFFNSQHTSTRNCSNIPYTFPKFRINSSDYNQLIFNCNISSLIFRNHEQNPPVICPNDEDHLRIYFPQLSLISIEVNSLQLHGIELCSLDDLVRTIYHEYSYYRARSALLINLKNNKQEQSHIALTTNGEMTFLLFLSSSENDTAQINNEIHLIFPNENIFKFNQSSLNVRRIDQGYVRSSKSFETPILYQLSKSKFTLFNNETFLLYGTQLSYPRRFSVYIDETLVICKYDYILQCTFPILPLNLHDTHEPFLKIIYNGNTILNRTVELIPRMRLHQVRTNHSVRNITTFKVNIDGNLCANESLASLFTFIIHLWKEEVNGTQVYELMTKNEMAPVACHTTAEIGQKIKQKISNISIDNIISMNVDLIHQWYDYQSCRAERTRISFV